MAVVCPWVFRWNSHKGAVLEKVCLAYLYAWRKENTLCEAVVFQVVRSQLHFYRRLRDKLFTHRLGVVGNRRTTCTDQGKHRSTPDTVKGEPYIQF